MSEPTKNIRIEGVPTGMLAIMTLFFLLMVADFAARMDCALGVVAACEQIEAKYEASDDHSNP